MAASDAIQWVFDFKPVWLVHGFGWLLLSGFFFTFFEDLMHAESRRQRARIAVVIVVLAMVATYIADWLYAEAALLEELRANPVRGLSHIGLFFGILVSVLGVAWAVGRLAALLVNSFRKV